MKKISENSIVIPTNTIKQILKNETKQDVSKQAVQYVKQLVESYLDEIIQQAVKNMEETNVIREKANLPKQKRISVSHFKNLPHNHYNPPNDFLHDERGLTNRETRLSNADMEVV
jgi:hypothetical protein